MLNLLAGGGLTRMSFFAIGVGPYITSQIIVQLLSSDLIPPLSRLSKQGERGKHGEEAEETARGGAGGRHARVRLRGAAGRHDRGVRRRLHPHPPHRAAARDRDAPRRGRRGPHGELLREGSVSELRREESRQVLPCRRRQCRRKHR